MVIMYLPFSLIDSKALCIGISFIVWADMKFALSSVTTSNSNFFIIVVF